MKLKDFSLFIALIISAISWSQTTVTGIITSEGKPVADSEVYIKSVGLLAVSDSEGKFEFTTEKNSFTLVVFNYDYKVYEKQINLVNGTKLNVNLQPLGESISEVEITARKRKTFELKRLKDVEGTAIYAGKKNEVILVEQSMANVATNNARQIYGQIAGLNIFQNDDAGLQLNVGGRGLDPRRTSNFNTRQNGYDISADVLGYPESYYTPPAETLEEIQIIRGAASLQYGTQFGGLINFKFRKPSKTKKLQFITRNTVGSNGLYTNFTSADGTVGKLDYYTFFNYKKGDGFRPNSEYESKNAFVHLGYQLSEKTAFSAELTYMNYLAQQAGGLTDAMFEENPFQSNRTRNWFEVDWLLYNVQLAHQFSENTNFTFQFFGLDASRNALGFRGNYRLPAPNPVLDVDEVVNGEYVFLRDLIKGDYNNFGFETRLLSKYKAFGKQNTFLVGAKYYKANNTEAQGAGSNGTGADFSFVQSNDYINSDFDLPNENVAIFGETILKLSDKLSVTPGIRFEYIKTASEGNYTRINRDGAGNPIGTNNFTDNRTKERNLVLLGLGASYKPNSNAEFYGNISQNYRSVTFSDIRTVNPSFLIDPNIQDEKGFTFDVGVRGRWSKYLNYDISGFALFYNDKIGVILESEGPDRGDRLRTNIGDARILGIESLVEWNILPTFDVYNNDYTFTFFNNLALISSEYTKTIARFGVEGKEVEFVPSVNLKNGLKFGYKNLLTSLQYTYLSSQFSDATNATEPNNSGTRGEIPSYGVLDFSASYTYKYFKLEAGINNILDEHYFTRRATGYPGPGILPSPNRNWYVGLEIKL